MGTFETKLTSSAKEQVRSILAILPYESGFHFFIESKTYTGKTAISLSSFYEQLKTMEIRSVIYHFQRRDFQNWIANTIGDTELAARLDYVKADSHSEKQD